MLLTITLLFAVAFSAMAAGNDEPVYADPSNAKVSAVIATVSGSRTLTITIEDGCAGGHVFSQPHANGNNGTFNFSIAGYSVVVVISGNSVSTGANAPRITGYECLEANIGSIVVAPTCTDQGYTKYTCTHCGDSYNDNFIDENGHSYESVVTPMTPFEDGFTTHTCSVCDESYVDNVVTRIPYDWQIVAVVAPTCTSQGYTVYEDSYWNAEKNDDYKDALGHAFESVVTAPTCIAKGYTTFTCSNDDCGKSYNEEYVRKLGHDYIGVVTDPTCTAPGFTTYTCSRCVEEYVAEETEALDHTPGKRTDVLDPTCTAEGAWEIRCEVCNEVLESGEIEATGHTPGDRVDTKDPNCTEAGAWEVRCEVCGVVVDSGSIIALGHTPGEKINLEVSSCTGAGSWEICCEVCKLVIDSGEINATGHTPGERVETSIPTCTGEGAWENRCEVCDALLESGETDALGHTEGAVNVIKDPTLSVKGAWEIRCEVCDVLLESGEIDALKVVSASNARFVSMLPENGKSNSKVWVLTFKVDVILSNGVIDTLTYSINLNGNNANQDGKYTFGIGHDLAGFTLTYDIKGNGSNIKAFSVK